MRIVFSGAGPMTVMTAQNLAEEGHEIIVIEVEKEKIDQISEELDCSFVHGDASKPAVLNQVDPKACDFLFCLTNSDQVNIITALLGRSMGFERVVPSIENVELQQLCKELGLDDTIIPVHTMSRYLLQMIQGLDSIELSTFLKNDARLFSFIAGKAQAEPKDKLDLPDNAEVIFYYRKDAFKFVDASTRFKKDDEIVILTQRDNLEALRERFNPKTSETEE